MSHSDGTTLADKVALAIGLCGENMVLSRAIKVGVESRSNGIGWEHNFS